jgi:segregation and condensation protein A
MTYTFRLPEFEGPLDLLLRLIERAELDITSIALAQVADEYLAHVRGLDDPDPRAVSEFLVIAARLLLIKSRALLPRPPVAGAAATAADPDAEELAQQLRLYQQYKRVAQQLRAWSDEERRVFVRQAPPPVIESEQELDVSVAQLVAAVRRRLQLALTLEGASEALPLPHRLTVREAAERVRVRLERQAWITFDDLLSLAITRQEVIVTLWAVLELLKRGAIQVEQPALFGPILIGRGAALAETLPELEGDE